MLALAQQLTASKNYTAVLLSAEVGAPFKDDIDAAEKALLGSWRGAIQATLPVELHPPAWPDSEAGNRIQMALQRWAEAASRPLVILIDEIDTLQDSALITLLRQVRDGYPRRPDHFPQSLALIGLRDVRDYKVAAGGSDRLNTSSPFNIKVESLTLRDFTRQEVAMLYAQHTQDTGQVFTPEAVERAFELTQGQPWLVNALARQAVEVIQPDVNQALTVEDFNQAKEILIQRQDTHLDSLAERLREPRVRAIIEPMLAGQELNDVSTEVIRLVLDLGLCRMDPEGGLVIANPIYRDVLPRVLAFPPSASLPRIAPTWLTPEGLLGPPSAFRRNFGFLATAWATFAQKCSLS
jgi:hypothetical protein